jgi:hypothetical protein
MDWLLTTSHEMRIWFVKGLAYSDVDGDLLDRSVSRDPDNPLTR